MDRKAAESMASEAQTLTEPAVQEEAEREAKIVTPYPGKFDPKAIVKKATGQQGGLKALGNDVALPTSKLNPSVPIGRTALDCSTDQDRSINHVSAQGLCISDNEDCLQLLILSR